MGGPVERRAGPHGSNRVAVLQERPDGGIWVGTLGAGLNLFDPVDGTFVHHVTRERSLEEDRTVEVLYEDSRGGMWIGTRSGVKIISPGG